MEDIIKILHKPGQPSVLDCTASSGHITRERLSSAWYARFLCLFPAFDVVFFLANSILLNYNKVSLRHTFGGIFKMWKRKTLKKKARKYIRTGFWRMMAVCFLIAALTSSYPLSTSFVSQHVEESSSQQPDSAYIPEVSNSEVLTVTITHISDDDEVQQEVLDSDSFQAADILIDLYTNASSAVFSALRAFNSLLADPFSYSTLFLVLGVFFSFFYQFFIANLLLVGQKRFFLELRNYPQTRISKIFYLYKLRYLWKPAWVMFWRSFFQLLWSFTIVGGIIKRYEYSLIPYILAENPAVGRKDAFYLSRQLMMGNKWQLFLLDVSFIGWKCLSALTLGVLDFIFVNPYIESTKAELYMTLRRNYVLSRSACYEKLNDLTLEHVLSEDELLISKALYDDSQGPYTKTVYFAPEQYPVFLYSIQPPAHAVDAPINPKQRYSLRSLCFLFYMLSIFGWLLETGITLIRDGSFLSHSFLWGPWIPLYGICGVCILILMRRLTDKPVLVFLLTMGLYAALEYGINWLADFGLDMQLRDYSGYFLNLNGRVYLGGTVAYALLGCMFLYYLAPVWNHYFIKLTRRKQILLCILLSLLLAADLVFSVFVYM